MICRPWQGWTTVRGFACDDYATPVITRHGREAARGSTHVVLLEREELAFGSPNKAAGGISAQY